MTNYGKIVYEGGRGEIVEKKSRFLAEAAAVGSEEEAASFLTEIRKRTWDARHHCSAFVLGPNNEFTHCSDDGEPSGTAGRPILDVLVGSGVHDACIVVTRYFGGVLLGTGGLVRAYGRAAGESLAASVILEKIPGRKFRLVCDYSSIGKIRYLAAGTGAQILEEQYAAQAALICLVPEEETARFAAGVGDATGGRAFICDLGEQAYAVREGETILL